MATLAISAFAADLRALQRELDLLNSAPAQAQASGPPSLDERRERLREHVAAIRTAIEGNKRVIIVNVPSYTLTAYEDGEPVLRSRVIVGAVDRRTPQLETDVAGIQLNPAWSAPPRVVKGELMRKGHVERHHRTLPLPQSLGPDLDEIVVPVILAAAPMSRTEDSRRGRERNRALRPTIAPIAPSLRDRCRFGSPARSASGSSWSPRPCKRSHLHAILKYYFASGTTMATDLRVLSADDRVELDHVRQFFRNYAAWLGVDLCFQGFAEEMASLPGAYSAPAGRLFYTEVDGQPAGCVGLRPLSEGICEMKRLYVEPRLRGQGIGRALVLAAIRAAKDIGYRRMMLDTLPAMRIAVKLYRDMGFQEAPAYYQTPLEGTIFLSLDLGNWSEEEVENENLFHLFDFNRAWAQQMRQVDPGFFEKLSKLQSPQYLWIGCSDSRVPANQIIGLLPGEVFVHRNVANVVVHTDLNCLSVVQFAVDVLKVRHIMVVGHYGCGGVKAALQRDRVGLVDLWLRHVQDVHVKHRAMIDDLPLVRAHDRLCEFNVLEQVVNLCQTIVVQDAWQRGQPLTVHGWIYALKDGLLRDLGLNVHRPQDLMPRYVAALEALA